MAARSVWKGFIRLSLASVPVKAYNALIPPKLQEGLDPHVSQIDGFRVITWPRECQPFIDNYIAAFLSGCSIRART